MLTSRFPAAVWSVVRHRLVAFVAAGCLWGSGSVTTRAQEPPSAAPAAVPAPSAVPAPGGGGAVIEDDTSGLYLNWSLVAIAVGLAVFAVCRSSRRN